jgi:hypothetical protein
MEHLIEILIPLTLYAGVALFIWTQLTEVR